MKKPERILIKKSVDGNVDAFEELIKDYEKRAYNIAYRLLKNPEDAMDVVQEAFIKVYKSIKEFKFKSSFSTWVYRIVVNTSIDFMRSKKVVYSLDETIKCEKGDIKREIADYENTPEIELERKLAKELVQKSIDKLDDIHRTVIILRDIQGFSYDEISEILCCSFGTVKSRISRGRIALKEIILKEMEHKDVDLSQKNERRETMDCKSFEEKMSLYIDDMLDEMEKKELKLHLNECSKCRILFEKMNSIVNYARDCEEIELPKDFNEKLRIKLKEIERPESFRKKFKILSALAAALLIVVLSISMVNNFQGINSKNQDAPMEMQMASEPESRGIENTDYNDFNYDTISDEAAPPSDTGFNEQKEVKKENRKIIDEAYIDLDVEDYDIVFNEIIDYVKSLGGFIENSETGYQYNKFREEKDPLKRGYLKIRVPCDKFEDTIKYIDSLGIIKRKNLVGRDVTEQYYDIENRVKNLKIQEERLREILSKAEKVEEILMIENELRRIRTEIDQNTSVLKKWDSLVALATINISLNEVEVLNKEIKNVDKSIFEKSKEGFITTVNSIIKLFEKTIIFLITILPIIILLFILFVIAYFLYRKYKFRRD